jgi:hypothetical protein
MRKIKTMITWNLILFKDTNDKNIEKYYKVIKTRTKMTTKTIIKMKAKTDEKKVRKELKKLLK